jgi:CheY-like chemotaxis protein
MADGNEARGARPRLAALVIDDHEPGRLLASLVLEHFGLTVDTAVDATDGAARVRRKAYDIVLIDRVLGDEDGLALATRLAAETRAAVVMVSGMTPPEVTPPGLAGWLMKPYTPRQMYGVVARALAGYGKMLGRERIV